MIDFVKENNLYKNIDDLIERPYFMNMNFFFMNELNVPDMMLQENGLIWHYTDSNGLLGILRTNKFWSTHNKYLNDKSEGRHFVDKFIELLAKKFGEEIGYGTNKGYFAEQVIRYLSEPDEYEQFVTCFCRNGDLLSQWRGYGSFGGGYALGFEINDLRLCTPEAELIKMSYEEEKLENTISEMVGIYFKSIDRYPKHRDDAESHTDFISKHCATLISFASSCFKHPKYSEEDEVRLVMRSPNADTHKILFRTRNQNIIPYVELDMEKFRRKNKNSLPLKKIIIGPGVEKGNSFDAISLMLRGLEISGVGIEYSLIPFRN